jgi:predicted glycosyltransferase
VPEDNIYSYLGIPKNQKYALVRLASLTAHHDAGIKGVSENLLQGVIELCSKFNIQVFITSEKPLAGALEKYRLPIPLSKIFIS